MTGRGRRSAVALWVVLAAAAALLACAGGASAAGPPPPVSIVIDDGLTATRTAATALPPASCRRRASRWRRTTRHCMRLALTLAALGGRGGRRPIRRSCSGSSCRTESRSRAPDAVALLLGIRLQDGETVAGTDAVSLLLGIRLADGETVTASDLVSLLLGIRQTVTEPVSVGDDVSAKAIVAPTTTTVTTSGSPALAGASVTFTASVASAGSPVHAGSVVFSVDGTLVGQPVPVDGNGVAQLTTSTLALGSHTVKAGYGGTTAFQRERRLRGRGRLGLHAVPDAGDSDRAARRYRDVHGRRRPRAGLGDDRAAGSLALVRHRQRRVAARGAGLDRADGVDRRGNAARRPARSPFRRIRARGPHPRTCTSTSHRWRTQAGRTRRTKARR